MKKTIIPISEISKRDFSSKISTEFLSEEITINHEKVRGIILSENYKDELIYFAFKVMLPDKIDPKQNLSEVDLKYILNIFSFYDYKQALNYIKTGNHENSIKIDKGKFQELGDFLDLKNNLTVLGIIINEEI